MQKNYERDFYSLTSFPAVSQQPNKSKNKKLSINMVYKLTHRVATEWNQS